MAASKKAKMDVRIEFRCQPNEREMLRFIASNDGISEADVLRRMIRAGYREIFSTELRGKDHEKLLRMHQNLHARQKR